MSNHPTLTPQQIQAELKNQGSTAIFETVINPVADELRDVRTERRYYQNVPVIPFFEKGDVTLAFMNKLAKLSPTHAAVIKSIRNYVLGGQLEVVAKKVPGFARRDSDLRDVPDEVFTAFTEWLTRWIDGAVLLNTVQRFYDNFKKFGNAYLEVVLTQVAGRKQVALYCHDVDRCLYLATLEGMNRVLLISPYWYSNAAYVNEVPDAVPLYPNFVEDGAGTKRTILHLKYETSGREWYGEPDWLASLYNSYGEIQRGQYNVQNYSEDFTGSTFIETFEGFGAGHGSEAPASPPLVDAYGNYLTGPQGFARRMDQFYTNKSLKKRRWMHRNAPADAQPSKVHTFPPNTNEKYHVAMAALDEAGILKMHDWHPALMGVQTPGKLGQNQEFATAFRQKYYTVIKPLQDTLLDPVNLALRLIAEFVEDEGRDLVQANSLGLKNLYADVLKNTGEMKGEAPQNGTEAVDEGDPFEADDKQTDQTED